MSLQIATIRQDYFVAAEPEVTFRSGIPLREIEKTVILETLRRLRFNRTRTAKVLGIGIRTLQRKLKQYRETDTNIIVNFPAA